MKIIKSFLLKSIPFLSLLGLLTSCDTSKKENEHGQIEDADKTEMMEEEHQMDPGEHELMNTDTMPHDTTSGVMRKEERKTL